MSEPIHETLLNLLVDRGLISREAQPYIEPLGWGISNVVLKVSVGDDCFVVKHPLPKLRVKDDWYFDQSRVVVEHDCMALLGELLPEGSVPKVRFFDRAHLILGMSCAPSGGFMWKEALLDGEIDMAVAQRAGELLADVHNYAAEDPRTQEEFGDNTVFLQGRVDPYHWTSAKAHPDLAPLIEAEVERMLQTRVTLVHGDYSPKNIFVYPERLLILDFEVAQYGDPAFDAAFCLNHLVLKAIKFPGRRGSYLEAAGTFWRSYVGRQVLKLHSDLEAATICELGCLLLARIDGKSKVEYITDEPTREVARGLAREILTGSEESVVSLLAFIGDRLAAMWRMTLPIESIHAREVLDSRGRPTVEVEVRVVGDISDRAIVPSGSSTGRHEALELRDGDQRRFNGLGVRKVVRNVNEIIGPKLAGYDVRDQATLDEALISLDGTDDKSRLGANALFGVSLGAARAAATAAHLPLWRYLGGEEARVLPLPMVNIISGGLHAESSLDFQDFLIVAVGAQSYSQALEMSASVYRSTRDLLLERGLSVLKADEGGFSPALPDHRAAIELLLQGIKRAGLRAGEEIAIALDLAASHFYDPKDGSYRLGYENKVLDSQGLIEWLADWTAHYPIVSIEDGQAEDDWDGWQTLTARLGDLVLVVGDDLFATNAARLKRGIDARAANAILVKMNQVGTLSETLAVIEMAKQAGFRPIISARSGETEDVLIADLAVATNAGQIKIGSLAQSDRLAKYNQLLRIEERLGKQAEFYGRKILEPVSPNQSV